MTKKWEDRGRGNLTLRRAKQQPGDSGPNTPFLVFTMESGRSAKFSYVFKIADSGVADEASYHEYTDGIDGMLRSPQGAAECEPV